MWKVFRILQKERLIRDANFRPSLSYVCPGNGKHLHENKGTSALCDCVGHAPAVPYSKSSNWFSSQDQQSTKGGNDYNQKDQEHDFNWQSWTHSFQQDIWSSKPSCHILEAVGWGTAIVFGLRMSHLMYSSRNRQDGNNRCWLTHFQKVVTSVIRQGCLEFETGISSTVKTMLPRGVFGSLPLPASYVEIVNDMPSVESVTTNVAASPIEERKGYEVIQNAELGSIKVSGVSDVVKHVNMLQFDAGRNHSSTTASDLPGDDLKNAVIYWIGTVKMTEALLKNAKGVNEANHGNMDEAIRLWRQAIELADCEHAHFNLALSYERGLGIQQNLDEALKHYQYAAKKNHSASLYNLAVIHLRHQHDVSSSKAKAMKLLERASEIGSREAQRELGVLYTEWAALNMKRAACLFQKAAGLKDLKSAYFLGICYENGWGVERNDIMAAQLYEKAAAGGLANAQFNLGVFYDTGRGGLPYDKGKAINLYKLAADHGYLGDKNVNICDGDERKLLLSNNRFNKTESLIERWQMSWRNSFELEHHHILAGYDTNNIPRYLSNPVYTDLVFSSADECEYKNKSVKIVKV